MRWQHTEPGTSSHPAALIPVWMAGTGGRAQPGAGKGISPCQSHCQHLSPMWLPGPSQGLEHCIQPQQGDYSEHGTCLESHHPHSLLSVCCSKHRSHHSPIFQTHFGTGQLLWTFELFCMLQHVRNFFLVLEQTWFYVKWWHILHQPGLGCITSMPASRAETPSLSSINNGEKCGGKCSPPSNKTHQALGDESSGSPSLILSSNRGKGSCYTEETELKNQKINLKGQKRDSIGQLSLQ